MTRAFSLFARPSFVEGIGRIVDFGGTLNTYNTSPSAELADARALGSDFAAVTEELRAAVQKVAAG